MTAVEYGSPYEASDMCLGSQLDTAPITDTPLLAAITDDEHDERIPVYIEVDTSQAQWSGFTSIPPAP